MVFAKDDPSRHLRLPTSDNELSCEWTCRISFHRFPAREYRHFFALSDILKQSLIFLAESARTPHREMPGVKFPKASIDDNSRTRATFIAGHICRRERRLRRHSRTFAFIGWIVGWLV